MIKQEDIDEIKKRDFFANKFHYRDHDDVETRLELGEWPEEEVFLTIILPVYDHPIDFIIRAIKSVISQKTTFSYMLLISDDFASDRRINEVENYIRNNWDDHILYYKNEKNIGVFGNWNRAIELSRSKWIAMLHSDDFLRPNYLQNMCKIVLEHDEIDQLACKYTMINYIKGNVDEKKYMKPLTGEYSLRKVDYREYFYEMYTSVKGSMIKRQTLIDLGGFRSQGDGLGLDDYPLMMRYAKTYNTYYLDADLYIDSWGYNDSLNPKHWYPELISNYYMWKNMESYRNKIIRWIYDKNDAACMLKRASEYANGTSWIGEKIDVDFDELCTICDINLYRTKPILSFLCNLFVRIDQKIIKISMKKQKIMIK